MQISPGRIKAIIITAVIFALLFAGLSLFAFLKFRISATSPDPNNYPSSLGVLNLTFNRKLNSAVIKQQFTADNQSVVKFSFNSTSLIDVENETLKITIGTTPLPGKYTITLNNIQASDGSFFSATIPFIVKDIPYNRLNDTDRRLFDEATVDGETLPKSPLTNVLPHETSAYKISYTLPPEYVELPPTITITMKFFEPGDVALPATPQEVQAYLTKLRSTTQEALTYLESEQIDVSKYTMNYTEPRLRNEFPVGFQAAPPQTE